MLHRAVLALALLAGVMSCIGCQRAGRYPSALKVKLAPREPAPEPAKAIWSWYLPEGWQPAPDVPLRFVASTSHEWDRLPSFWNSFPTAAAGARTVHLGQSPLGSATALLLADRLEVVKIKVPRGLPDPTPGIPAANPPTLGKWKLGRKLFFDRKLAGGGDTFACATCHRPDLGFAEDRARTAGGSRNTPSLINVVYNRSQFWDGRAATLEEILVRSLDDETLPEQKSLKHAPQDTHRWGGLVRVLGADLDYTLLFEQVFHTQPTQDAVAKALATYLRTLLSGDSLYDRAEDARQRHKAPELLAEHFAAVLDDNAVLALRTQPEGKEAIARKLAQGARLFGQKGCAACHAGPLFTDHDFHNVGIGDSDAYRPAGEETGRFPHVPIGLKEPRFVGAYRTPTLRALPRTAPYFHDGSYPDLLSVVKYFNHSVHGYRAYLAPALLDADGRGRRLDMTFEDEASLVVFLRALDGQPVDSRLVEPGNVNPPR